MQYSLAGDFSHAETGASPYCSDTRKAGSEKKNGPRSGSLAVFPIPGKIEDRRFKAIAFLGIAKNRWTNNVVTWGRSSG